MLANRISQAIEIVRQGGIIVYSTDTIVGLGCDPYNQNAVEKILWLKRRSVGKGLILLVANLNEGIKFSKPLSKLHYEKINSRIGKKPTTWLLPINNSVPSWIIGNHSRVAIRVIQNGLAEKLCSAVGVIVSTSANIAKYPPIENEAQARNWFGPFVDYVIMGPPGTGEPSEVCDLVSGQILR